MKKLLSLLKSGWFIALVGVLLLSVLIWLGGPYLGIGDSQPLASPVTRLVVIIVLIASWAVVRLAHLGLANRATFSTTPNVTNTG